MPKLALLLSTVAALCTLTCSAVGQDDGATPMDQEREIQRLRGEVSELNRRLGKMEALESQLKARLSEEVNAYLCASDAEPEFDARSRWDVDGLKLSARFTSVAMGTVNADPYNRTVVHGDIDLDFVFKVSDTLDFFINLTANNNEGAFPAQFGDISGTSEATISGQSDGIGVDGTVSVSPGSIRVDETGIIWSFPAGEMDIHLMMGKLDPRNYYAQNAFANDENTQFLNNLFDDPPAITWRTDATGPTLLGLQTWVLFGERAQYRLDFGWFNYPGQFFNRGLLLAQFTWSTDRLAFLPLGRSLNLRIYASMEGLIGANSVAGGASVDMWATEKIGVFVRITVRDNKLPTQGDDNLVESDWTVGAVFQGPVSSRPDDSLGVAWGLIKGPFAALGATSSTEQVIEVYYRFVLEEGKLQITPSAQFILDPGGGSFTSPDLLVLLGLRVHIPF